VRKVAVAAGILGLLAAVAAIVIGTLLWSARRKLDERSAWVEAELQRRSREAAAVPDFDWAPYREFLAQLRTDSWSIRSTFPYYASNDHVRSILVWRDAGSSLAHWSVTDDVGPDNSAWPYIFGVPDAADVPRFLRGAPMAQDFFRGGGFAGAIFRASAERRLHCGWRYLLERSTLSPEVLTSCVELLDRLEAARPSLKDEIELEHLLRCREVLEIYRTGQDPRRRLETLAPGFRSFYMRAMLFGQVLGRLDGLRSDALFRVDHPLEEVWAWLSAPSEPSFPLAGIYDAMDRSVFQFEVLSSLRRRLLRTALAVARYQAATGALPDRLDQLVPAYLPEIPVCPLTGAPLSYSSGTVSAPVADPLATWTVRSAKVN
jgi:hypothetical protein